MAVSLDLFMDSHIAWLKVSNCELILIIMLVLLFGGWSSRGLKHNCPNVLLGGPLMMIFLQT